MYCVAFQHFPGHNGLETISEHRTLQAAVAAYRSRNRHLVDSEWAQAHGMANAGTFDHVMRVIDGELAPLTEEERDAAAWL